jgi:hypothetical protein
MNRIDDAIVVDIPTLLRKGLLMWGKATPSTTLYGTAPNGERFSINYSADARGPRPHVRLLFVDCRGKVTDQKVDVVLTRPHLGGVCPWFWLDGKRARKLFLSPGASRFTTRAGMVYACRHLGRKKRTRLREEKWTRKHGVAFQIYKPPGMWNRTWQKKLAQWREIDRRAREAEGKRSEAQRAVRAGRADRDSGGKTSS